jgi:hypothetical protein
MSRPHGSKNKTQRVMPLKLFCKQNHNLSQVGVNSLGACKQCSKEKSKLWNKNNLDRYRQRGREENWK